MTRPEAGSAGGPGAHEVMHGGLGERERELAAAAGVEVVDLSANLHPDGPPAEVLDALRNADIGRYPPVDAGPLRDAIAALHRVPPECVIVTPGASAAIYLALAALVAPRDRCATVLPTFGEYERAIVAAGGAVVRHVAPPPAFDLAAALDGARGEVEVAVLCHPNNPTGLAARREDVERLLAWTRYLLIDAAYEPLAERGGAGAWEAAGLVREGAPVVVVHSLTKLFAMPGIRLGYAIAPPSIAAMLRGRQAPWPIGSADMAAGLRAVAGIETRLSTLPALHDRRRRLERALAEHGIRTTASTTNFVLAEVGDAPAFRSALLARGFAVRDATSFGLPAWVRIAVPSEAVMAPLVQAIAATLVGAR